MPEHTSWLSFYRDPLRGWFLFFLLIQLGFSAELSTNPTSRWAMLAAMTEDGTVRIDAYNSATIDWARTPDGHYFSNKAPGPALLGEPVFAYLDAWQTRAVPNRDDRDRIRYAKGAGNLRFLSVLFQVLPFFFLGLWMLRILEKAGASQSARAAALVALFFGNTACLFLNQYFGHGCASVCALALYFAVLDKRVGLSAFFFGLGMLCEYSGALLLLPLLPFWIGSLRQSTSKGRWVAQFVAGAALPALAWIAYHTYCFGSPFGLPGQFQNPIFVEQVTDRANLWGIFFLPSAEALWGLTLGAKRGLLFTQPWVLLLIGALLFVPKTRRALFASQNRLALGIPLVFFVLLFLMNSSFGGWHGGGTAGPRYLTAGLVLLAPVLGLVWDTLSPLWRKLAWGLIAVSVFLQLVYLSVPGAVPPETVSLFEYFWGQLTGEHAGPAALRLALTLPLAAALFYRTWTGVRELKSPNKKAALSAASRH